MLKTRNLNAQFAYAVSRNEMTEDTRHNGGSSGAPFERVSQEITFPTHKQVFVFTLLFVTCQTTLPALGRGQLR